MDQQKPSILFVDDEKNLLQGLQRSFYSMRSSCTLRFAEGGRQALEMLAQAPADIVISDMRMPNMDGVELLGQVQKVAPQAVRIILSGNSDHGMVRRTVHGAHQFLSKPIAVENLKAVLLRTIALRGMMANPEVIARIGRLNHLPTHPRLLSAVRQELEKADPELKKVGAAISRDIGMSARLLQLVNSAFFGLARRIVDPIEAMELLGVTLLKALLLEDFVQTDGAGVPDGEADRLWRHSLRVSAMTAGILTAEQAPKNLVETGRTAGVLHDAGRLLLRSLPGSVPEPPSDDPGFIDEAIDEERRVFQVTHAEVGAYLLGIWGLPDELVEAVAWHHQPAKIPEGKGTLVPVAVHFADAFSRRGSGEPRFDLESLRKLGVEARLPAWTDLCKTIEGNPADDE